MDPEAEPGALPEAEAGTEPERTAESAMPAAVTPASRPVTPVGAGELA